MLPRHGCWSPADFVGNGGMDRANLALARYLADSGHPVHLVAHSVDAAVAQLPMFLFVALRFRPAPICLASLCSTRAVARLPAR